MRVRRSTRQVYHLEGKDQLPARRDVGKPCSMRQTILANVETVIDPFFLKLILYIRHRALGLAVELDEDCYYAAKFTRSEQTTKRASLNQYVCHWWSPLAVVPPSVVCYSSCSLGARISQLGDPHISSARFQTNEAHVALSASCRYEGHRLQQLGLQEAATGLMLDACRATSLCNAEGCNGIDDLTYGGQGEGEILKPRLTLENLFFLYSVVFLRLVTLDSILQMTSRTSGPLYVLHSYFLPKLSGTLTMSTNAVTSCSISVRNGARKQIRNLRHFVTIGALSLAINPTLESCLTRCGSVAQRAPTCAGTSPRRTNRISKPKHRVYMTS